MIHDWREEPGERLDDRSPPTGQIKGEEMHETVGVLREIIGMQFIHCNEASQFPTNQSRKLDMLRNFEII